MITNRNSQAYAEGCEAALDDKDISECPYPHPQSNTKEGISQNRWDWFSGYWEHRKPRELPEWTEKQASKKYQRPFLDTIVNIDKMRSGRDGWVTNKFSQGEDH